MSTHHKRSFFIDGVPLLEEIARCEANLETLVRQLKQELEDRVKIEHESKLLKECIESVSKSSKYRTRLARAKRLEELNATAARELECRSDLKASTAKAVVIRKKVDEAIEHRRIVSCRALCETMQRLLPREIRDMVYGFLFDQETWAYCGVCSCFVPGVFHLWHNPKDSFFPSLRCRATMPKHLRSSEALGTETYSELGEAWYRTTPSFIDRGISIAPFLRQDVFNTGINAASHARQVHLVIRTTASSFEYCDKFIMRWSGDAQKWVDGIKDLRLLKENTNISVRINYYAGNTSPGYMRIYLEILQRILSALNELPNASSRITIHAHEHLHGISDIFDRKTVTLDEFTERVRRFLQQKMCYQFTDIR